MSDYYKLVDRVAVPCSAEEGLLGWRDPAQRRVALTYIGDVKISTVFMPLNHQWGDGPPLIFETMVFGGPLDEEQERCSTWSEAEAMHEAMCRRVREAK